jgi:rhodanese-related sulfurtransferase
MSRLGQALGRAVLLAAAGASLGWVGNRLRPDGLDFQRFAAPTACESPAGPIAEISPTEASSLCGRPGVIIADARPAARYLEGHVADAVHLPCQAAGQVAQSGLQQLAGARTVVVYGDSTDEARPVAESLRRRLGAEVRVLVGGFPAWSQAGLACASGPCDGCSAEHRP